MDIQKSIQEIAELHEMQRQEKFKKDMVDFYTSIIAKSYEKASAYSKLIIMGGYAIYFTFWANVKNEVNSIWANRSAVLLIFSVLFFILWEIGTMICSSLVFRRISALSKVPPDKFEDEMKKVTKEGELFEVRYARFWIFQLIITIIPALIGVIILIMIYIPTLKLW